MKTVFVLLTLLFSFPAFSQSIQFTDEEKEWIEKHPRVEFGYEPQYYPYEIYQDGKYQGVAGDFIKIIEDRTGIEIVPIPNINWKQTTDGLKSGSVKMAPAISAIEERKEYMVFTDPYLEDPYVIATNENNYVGSVEELYGKTVAVPFGYTTNETLKKAYPQIKIVNKSSMEECLNALSLGEVDAYIGNLGVINYFIYRKGFTNLRISAPFGETDIRLCMGFSKDWVVFRDICQKVINSIPISQKNEIRRNWILDEHEKDWLSPNVKRWFIGVVLGLLLLLGLIYFWNRSLKKQVQEKETAQATLKKSYAQIQRQNEEKKVLLQEIHHRVKNNLQITTSMLSMQKNHSENEEVQRSLKDAMDRIKSISLIHERIYESESLDSVDPKSYIEALGQEILESFSAGKKVDLIVEAESGNITLKKMVPIALVVNELITNSVKHGFKNKADGTIQISFTKNESALTVVYFDDGIWLENAESKHFGTSLIETFIEQLDGKFDFSKENGTRYNFVFPVD